LLSRHAAALTLARRQVDFEFFDLKPVDFHGLRALFQRYLDGELPFALSELVETLIAQAWSEVVLRHAGQC
jgi:hypothetical protein